MIDLLRQIYVECIITEAVFDELSVVGFDFKRVPRFRSTKASLRCRQGHPTVWMGFLTADPKAGIVAAAEAQRVTAHVWRGRQV